MSKHGKLLSIPIFLFLFAMTITADALAEDPGKVSANEPVDKVEYLVAPAEKTIESAENKELSSYIAAATQGDAAAQFRLGEIYFLGDGVAKDYAEAQKWFLLSAEKGNADAQNYLSAIYYNGNGVTQDFVEARKWALLSAEKGNAAAHYGLGLMYYFGNGVTQDYAEARKWFLQSAEKGNADAQYYLGLIYYLGNGVTQDFVEARKWALLSAEKGNADAQYVLGLIYYLGNGVQQNYAEARKWFLLSAEKGNADAQYQLGTIYYFGNGVTQDYAEAQRWLLQSAEKGNADAQLKVAENYAIDLPGIPRNTEQSIKWYNKAAENMEGLDKELTKIKQLVVSGKIQEAYLGYKKIIFNLKNNPGWYEKVSPGHFYEMLSGFTMMYYLYSVSFVSNYLPDADIRSNLIHYRYLTLAADDIINQQKMFFVPLDEILNNKDDAFSNYGKYINILFKTIEKHTCGKKDRPGPIEFYYVCNYADAVAKAAAYGDYSSLLREQFYNPENAEWLNAINKYSILRNEYFQFRDDLKDFITNESMKNGSMIKSGESLQSLKNIDTLETWVKKYDNLLRYYLFDVPVIIFSQITYASVESAAGVFYGYDQEKIDRVAVPFSALSIPALPYTYQNWTRELWVETSKLIKQAVNDKKYEELKNISSKIRVPVELPKDFEVKWP